MENDTIIDIPDWAYNVRKYLEKMSKESIKPHYDKNKVYTYEQLAEILRNYNALFSTYISDNNYYLDYFIYLNNNK